MNKEIEMENNKKRDIEHRKGHLGISMAVGVLLVLSAVSVASAADPGDARGPVAGWSRGCAEQFELAQRTDMESFRDYDRETFREGDPRAVTIFASGAVRYGIDAIMAASSRTSPTARPSGLGLSCTAWSTAATRRSSCTTQRTTSRRSAITSEP